MCLIDDSEFSNEDNCIQNSNYVQEITFILKEYVTRMQV